MTWTITAAAAEWGVTRETVKRGLRNAGIEERKKYSTREIDRAIHGDLKAERVRETRARADLLEFKQRQKSGALVSVDDARQVISEALAPVRSRVLSLAANFKLCVNPSDPELAFGELKRAERWLIEGK